MPLPTHASLFGDMKMKTDGAGDQYAVLDKILLRKERPRSPLKSGGDKRHARATSEYGLQGEDGTVLARDAGAKSLDQARNLWLLRRRRDRLFSKAGYPSLFGEPIWDMLLDLYISGSNGQKISVSSLCIAAQAPQTTALRYLNEMLRARIVVRVDDPKDLRRSFVELSDEGFRLLDALFS